MERIIVYTDGGARGNPGPAGIGVSIQDESGVELANISKYIGETTNNQAEYEALYQALVKIKEMGLTQSAVEVRMDSELVVRQLEGRYKVKDPGLKEQFARVAKVQVEYADLKFTHVRREQNSRADQLVNEAIDASGH
ncbi:ribonuclease HI family protein [Candidatus Nomurabacteria bacterium]|nr:ribonuclease HI family protein [Candidatus Nomurabacteria bacterium]